MRKDDKQFLYDLASELNQADRITLSNSHTEGAVVIEISDELAKIISSRLFKIYEGGGFTTGPTPFVFYAVLVCLSVVAGYLIGCLVIGC